LRGRTNKNVTTKRRRREEALHKTPNIHPAPGKKKRY